MCVHKIHKCGLLLATLAKILIKLARKGEKKGGRLMISCDILQNTYSHVPNSTGVLIIVASVTFSEN